MDEEQPNPDKLLEAIQEEARRGKLGKLKIFFGMSAGVGKTYAMLEDAQRRLLEGVDVIVGTINTHGRKETEALLAGLKNLPEKWIKYKETVFEEFDLEAILELKPKLVLVDELAHTNVPGAKHTKRWQDVLEILDAGIDVYTTLNVQHIESRKDLVEGITGIQIRETVPDLVLERATTVELVDIPPEELLRRLKEGKVYLGNQSILAAQNFFREETLTALREIALRLTAEKVEHDLHTFSNSGRGWKTRERLMVAVSPSPSSQGVIRAARRLAFELDAPWIAVYIDTGVSLTDIEQTRLKQHLDLARDLGAEVITTHDLNVATALQRVATQREITRLMIGRPPKKRRGVFHWFQEDFIERLENENKNIDIIILRQDKVSAIYQKSFLKLNTKSPWTDYAVAGFTVCMLTLVGVYIDDWIGYKAVGFIFLFAILVLGFFIGRGPIFVAGILSAFSWSYFLVPTQFQLAPAATEDLIMFFVYLCTALTIGFLTSRIRQQDLFLHLREEKMEYLYEIEKGIASAANIATLRSNVSVRLQMIFPGVFDILAKGPDDQLNLESSLKLLENEKERAAARWVFQHKKIGGWSTETLPSAEALYMPIQFLQNPVGVLVYQPKNPRPLSMEELNFLQTVSQQLGIFLERYLFNQKISTQDYARQIEKIHQAIFHSLSRNFYGPLDEIITAQEKLRSFELSSEAEHSLKMMQRSVLRLKKIVDDMMLLSELQSGVVRLHMQKSNLSKLINACLYEISLFTKPGTVKKLIPAHCPLLPFDFDLMKLALINLLMNAIEHNAHQSITLAVELLETTYRISVTPFKMSLPTESVPLLFDPIDGGPDDPSKRLSVGFAIVKSVLEIHQGHLEASEDGVEPSFIALYLPLN